MRFTLSTRLALWASLLSGGWSSVVAEHHELNDININNNVATVHNDAPVHEALSSQIAVPLCPAGDACLAADDDFILQFDLGNTLHPQICNDLDLAINGNRVHDFRPHTDGLAHRLNLGQPHSDGIASLESHLSVVFLSPTTRQAYAVRLRVDSACAESSTPVPASSGNSDKIPFEIARIIVESIDGQAINAPTLVSLNVVDDSRRVTATLSSQTSVTPDDSELPETPSRVPSAGHETPSHDAATIEEEVVRLNNLRAELKDLRRLVKQQAKFVNALKAEDKHHHDAPHWPKCADSDVKCRVKVFIQKTRHCLKGCAHVVYHRIFSSSKPARPDLSAFISPLHPTQMHTLTTHRNSSREQHADPQYTRLPQDYADSDTESISDPDDAEIRLNAFKVALTSVASVFCLCVVFCGVRRRCCSPRAKADRAARREERRTRREYQSLARRKAWKDWVRSRVPGLQRRPSKRTSDYEEKRALILAQENVLEAAMQREIRALERVEGIANEDTSSVSAAERGQRMQRSRSNSNSNGTRSLPAYRSRASSGRPPSYSEIDRTPMASMTTLADGFVIYTPSATERPLDARSDITPDSSIADLSPRHSSETLRTERSF